MAQHLTTDHRLLDQLPEATVNQLPYYLRALTGLSDSGVVTISSEALARAAGVTPAKLRKDLSYLGSYGVRGVGYEVAYLCREIEAALGLAHDWPVVIVGMGNLGLALAKYSGFDSRGFRVRAVLDVDPSVVGTRAGALIIRPISELAEAVSGTEAAIGVITAPASAAQDVCDQLVAAGITSVLNFAPVLLRVPPTVDVRTMDLGVELQILAFHEQRRALAGVRTFPTASTGHVPDHHISDHHVSDHHAADHHLADHRGSAGHLAAGQPSNGAVL